MTAAYLRRRWVQFAELFAAILANRSLIALLPDANDLVVALLQELLAAALSVGLVAGLAFALRRPTATLTWTSRNSPIDGPSFVLAGAGSGMPMFTVDLDAAGAFARWILKGLTHVPLQIDLEPPGDIVVEGIDNSAPPGATRAAGPSTVQFDLRCARGDERHRARVHLRRAGSARETVIVRVRVADGAPARVRRWMRVRSAVNRIR